MPFFFFFGGMGFELGFTLAKQALYCLSHTSSPVPLFLIALLLVFSTLF
jgi:hypothetical protein